jgi:hypothetical protein
MSSKSLVDSSELKDSMGSDMELQLLGNTISSIGSMSYQSPLKWLGKSDSGSK